MRVNIKTNLWAGILCIAAAVVIWFLIPMQIGEPASENITVNARLFPQIFTVLIGVFGLILVAGSLLFHKETCKELYLWQEARVLGYYGMVALFVAAIPVLGFLIASILFVVLSLVYFKSRNKWHYISAVLVAVIIYLAFSKGLGVRF
ncbi:MAG: tripartite tricarboxylate transporter TctB family protein [Clostridiaceae bacterium]|nr:tripartite tricarboxylate transporter TctB family protein [Clostridiaceae bacterium]